MNWVPNLLSTFMLAAKRLWSNRILMLSVTIGLIAAVAIVMSVPLYADAISYRLLWEELTERSDENRPPFSFRFQYIGAWYGAVEWEEAESLDTYLLNRAPVTLGLPQTHSVRYFKTDNFLVFPASETFYEDARRSLGWAYVGFLTDFQPHIRLLEGRYPQPAIDPTLPIEVLVSRDMSDKVGFQVDEQYVLFDARAARSQTMRPMQLPIVIAGIWEM